MTQKIALITGASSGIGYYLTKALIHKDYKVVGCGRRPEPLSELEKQFSGNFIGLPGDITEDHFQNTLLGKAKELGSLDLLINNAGLGFFTHTEEMPLTKLDQIIAVNIVALTKLTIKALPLLKLSKGTLLNISSVLGHFSIPYSAVYCGSKHYVNGFSRSLRIELRGTGVRVLTVCPGSVSTEFFKVASNGKNEEDMGVNGEPAEKVVNGIIFQLENHNKLWIFPTLGPRFVSFLGRHFQALFDFILSRNNKKFVSRLIDK